MNNQNKISKWWTSNEEWKKGKTITPVSVVKLCGTETKAKFRDSEGCVFCMTYIDHDNDEIVRKYENQYDSFQKSMKDSGVKANNKYLLRFNKNGNSWKWEWNPVPESASGNVLG